VARRRRKGAHEALGSAIIVSAFGWWVAAAGVLAASEAKYRWWIVFALFMAGVMSLVLGLILYYGVSFRENRLAVRVSPPASLSTAFELPKDHSRWRPDHEGEGMVLLEGIGFTNLEPDDVSLTVELVASFSGYETPSYLQPRGHSADLPLRINLPANSPGVTGDISFPWNYELGARFGNSETWEVFSLRIVDQLTEREATVRLHASSVTDKL
jgi:hypothetical protein